MKVQPQKITHFCLVAAGELRALCRTVGTWLLLVVLYCGSTQLAWTLPMEKFESTFRITCGEGERYCSRVIRSDSTLGRYTGVAITKTDAGEVDIEVSRSTKGKLVVEAEDAPEFTLTFSWDGDSNPEQLSGSGLNCFDLTRQKASAFLISDVTVQAECAENPIGSECPSFAIEARAYNPADPTGQKFLVSRGRRNVASASDVIIPFSNFLLQGPRGGAQFGCVGAVTISLTFRDFSELDAAVGPIYSNGSEGLSPIPTPTEVPTSSPTVTPTATPRETPTVTPTNTPTPTFTSSATATRTPEAAGSGAATPGMTDGQSTKPSPVPVVTTAGPTPSVQPTSTSSQAIDSPATEQPPAVPNPVEDEEVVYGELVRG